MKNFRLIFLFTVVLLFITFTSCDSDSLTDLDRDIIGEWFVDDYILSGDNIVTNGETQDMHMLFEANYSFELSWFENGDFFIVDGQWSSNQTDSTIELNLDNRVFFFCGDDDIILNIFFFAGDMELDTACANDDWMEIQLERL